MLYTMLDTTDPSLDFTDLLYSGFMIPILRVLDSMVSICTFTLGFGAFTMLDTTDPSLDFTDLLYSGCMIPILRMLDSVLE